MAGVRQGDKTMTSRLKELERTTSDPIETDIQKVEASSRDIMVCLCH